MGESTTGPVVRLDGGRVVLQLDAVLGAEAVLLPLAGGEPTVDVSPARALELLDGLRDRLSELRDLVAEQEQRAQDERRAAALRSAVDLVMTEPLLFGWYSLEPHTYDAELGRLIQVNYADRCVPALEEYAAAAGVPVHRADDERWIVVLLGSAEEGWLKLRAYTSGRAQPEPAAGTEPGSPLADQLAAGGDL